MDVRLSKFLIFGAVLGCLDPVLTIAACLNGRPIFLNPREKRQEAKEYVLVDDTNKLGHKGSLLLGNLTFLQLIKHIQSGRNCQKERIGCLSAKM